MTGRCSTESWTLCFCSLAVTFAWLIKHPSFIVLRDRTWEESLLFLLSQTVTGDQKNTITMEDNGTAMTRRYQPGSGGKPICNPFRSTCAWLNMPLLMRLCGAVPRCKTLEIPLTEPCPTFLFMSQAEEIFEKKSWSKSSKWWRMWGKLNKEISVCLTPETSGLLLDYSAAFSVTHFEFGVIWF